MKWRDFKAIEGGGEPDPATLDDAKRRRLWRAWCALRDLARERGEPPPRKPLALRDLRCGVRTRSGGRCRRADLAPSGRCRLHGGMSAGPATPAGVEAARANLSLRWNRDTAA